MQGAGMQKTRPQLRCMLFFLVNPRQYVLVLSLVACQPVYPGKQKAAYSLSI